MGGMARCGEVPVHLSIVQRNQQMLACSSSGTVYFPVYGALRRAAKILDMNLLAGVTHLAMWWRRPTSLCQ